jgi:hypothetical protein
MDGLRSFYHQPPFKRGEVTPQKVARGDSSSQAIAILVPR